MFGLADDAVAQFGGRKRTVDAADGAEGQVHKVAGQPRGNRKHRLLLTAHEGTALEEGAAAAGTEGRHSSNWEPSEWAARAASKRRWSIPVKTEMRQSLVCTV